LTLKTDNTAFRMNTRDGTWKAGAITGAIALAARSRGDGGLRIQHRRGS
jgi:hypothetical protein